MGEDPLPKLRKFCITFRGFGKSKKRNILIITILVVATGLFFSVSLRKKALAEKNIPDAVQADLALADPMKRIDRSFPEKLEKDKQENGKRICEDIRGEGQDKKFKIAEAGYRNILSGYPMEEMVPALARQNKDVAAFLIGIAKKESNWGVHTPKKDGRECYNFWGFKGGYKLTPDGYSCFDSPEQAVDMVGARIQDLIAKKIDTPARMVVWKCGSTCKGHDPVAVAKWISDVSIYYYRLES